MTADQFRSSLDRLGLSQLGAARMLGVNDRTVRRWALNERSIPDDVADTLNGLIAKQRQPRKQARA